MLHGRGTGIVLLIVILATLLPAKALDAEESAFLTIINDYRVSYGLNSLSISPTLTVAAELHSQDMADNDYFSHYSLDGRSPLDRVIEAGYNYPTTVGENIAAGYITAANVFEAWRNSPSHNQTMLYPTFTVIGIGRAYNASSYYGWYWTTDLGGYDDSGGPPPPPPPILQVSSTTHPDQDKWYANDDPNFQWDPVPSAEGYSFLLDQSSTTMPDTTIDSTSNTKAYSDVEDGIWYFHARVKTSGGWGQPSHYRIMVDCTAPQSAVIESATHPNQRAEYPNNSPQLSWSDPPDTSGISGYSYLLDQSPTTDPDEVVDTTENQESYQNLSEGQWFFHLRAVDNAHNWGQTSHFNITVRFVPVADFVASPRSGFEPLIVTFTDLSSSSVGIVEWHWDFGDGCTSTEKNPTHIYEEEGNFAVTLLVREQDDDNGSVSKGDYIQVEEAVPDGELIESIHGFELVIGAIIRGMYVDADSYVEPQNPDSNYGHDPVLVVDSTGVGSYLSVELTSIPTTATILAASLGIYIESSLDLESTEIAVFQSPYSSWSETALLWNNRPLPIGSECDSSPIGLVYDEYLTLDVTKAISESISDDRSTFFLAISSGGGRLNISSREGTHRPILIVQYAQGDVHEVKLSSYEDANILPNMGEIVLDGHPQSLPSTALVVAGSYSVEYQGSYEFECWETTDSVLVTDQWSVITTIAVSGPGGITARGFIGNVTYNYDDGTPDFSIGRKNTEMVAVSFYPILVGDLTKIQIYVREVYGFANNTALIRILSPDGDDLMEPIPITPEGSGWLEIDVNDPVIITSEFLIALEYLNDDYPRIGVDDDGSNSSFIWNGFEWRSYHSNIMIRTLLRTLRPPKLISILSLQIDAQSPTTGVPLWIGGKLKPAFPESAVTLILLSPGGSEESHTLYTNFLGDFSTSFTPMEAGEWEAIASWEGGSGYQGTERKICIEVRQGQLHITCAVKPYISHFNDTVTIWGSVSPMSVPVALQYRYDGGQWTSLCEVYPLPNLAYAYDWVPPHVGNYELQASWRGNASFLGDSTFPTLHMVLKANSEIMMETDKTSTNYGSNVTIWGHISPPYSAEVLVECWRNMTWTEVVRVESANNGNYTYTWPVDFVGTGLLQVSWQGNAECKGATSNAILIRSDKASSTLTCIAEPALTELNESVTVYGRIAPPQEVAVTILITPPEGTDTTVVSASNSTGNYLTSFNPDDKGEWRIVASWEGNHVYEGCDSQQLIVFVEVKEKLFGSVLQTAFLIAAAFMSGAMALGRDTLRGLIRLAFRPASRNPSLAPYMRSSDRRRPLHAHRWLGIP